MSEKEFKFRVSKEKEPELYAWVSTLRYGSFPKSMMKILTWLYENEMLIKGGVGPLEQMVKMDDVAARNFEKEVLEKLNRLEDLLKSSAVKTPLAKTEEKVLDGSIEEVENFIPNINSSSNATNDGGGGDDGVFVSMQPLFQVYEDDK